MKKYFMKGTEDEVQFGDMIELDLTEDMENGHVRHHHLDCKFIPDLVPLLLEQDIVEEVVDEEEETAGDPLEFTENCSMLQEVIKANEALEMKVETLENILSKLDEKVKSLCKTIKKLTA